MKAIFASDLAGGFGFEGGLPWGRVPEDMKFFMQTTKDSVIIMGRKTFDTLPQLKGRTPVVVTSRNIPGINCTRKLVSMDAFLIGGASLLTPENLSLCGTIYHTTIKGVYEADVSISPDTLLFLSKLKVEVLLETDNCIIRKYTNEKL